MDRDSFNGGLLDFLQRACTPFHAAESMAQTLCDAGFRELGEGRAAPKEAVFLRRGGSLIALRAGTDAALRNGLRMVSAHTDSPCLMVKPQPEISSGKYRQLGIEVYGGALLNPWFDRDLSLAGRVSYATAEGAIASALVDFQDPVAVVPSLAIHLDREVNRGRNVNPQKDMAPLLGLAGAEDEFDLRVLLAARLRAGGQDVAEVLDFELCFYDVQPPSLLGLQREFIASARLDNLLSCYTGLQALLDAPPGQWCVLVCNDHEEVGSLSATGAQGPLLREFLRQALPAGDSLASLMQRSMMISADNAHGVHPNFSDRHDPGHGPLLNGGPVIKVNASQRYATSSDGAGLFRLLAREEGVPVQTYVTRADMACGSTIGPISAGELGVTTLDVGAPTFAMHSIRELAGSDDAWYLYRVLRRYFGRAAALFSEAAPATEGENL